MKKLISTLSLNLITVGSMAASHPHISQIVINHEFSQMKCEAKIYCSGGAMISCDENCKCRPVSFCNSRDSD